MDDSVDRLTWLREQAQLRSLSAAAEAYGVDYETYKKMARGDRKLTKQHVEPIASYHRVSPGWIMFGEGTPAGEAKVPLAGFIAAGQEITLFDDIGQAADLVDALIAGPEARAFEVHGNSMFPLAREGDVIFVGPERRDFPRLIGADCIVYLDDGRRLFKVIERGSKPGLYDLHSYNEQPLRDVAVHSAGPFLGLKRGPNRTGIRRVPR
jgi:phage repressor protein C with HTH and peptisase S24 domain